MATQSFYVIVDITGGVGGTLLYFIFPGICAVVLLQRKGSDIEETPESGKVQEVRFYFFLSLDPGRTKQAIGIGIGIGLGIKAYNHPSHLVFSSRVAMALVFG